MNDSEININKKFTPETILKKRDFFYLEVTLS